MSTAAKVILIIGISLILLVAGVVGVGIYWWTQHGQKAIEAGGNAMKEGTEAGKKTDNQGCVDEALTRYKNDKGFGGAISTSLFVRSCLEESRPTPGFCDDVPRATEFMKSAQWQRQKCKDAGISDQYCQQIFSQVQQYCEQARLRKKD